jgi:hypothetical protein
MAIGANGPNFPNVPSLAATAFTSETGFAKIRKNPEPESIARWTEVQELRRSPVIRGSVGQVNMQSCYRKMIEHTMMLVIALLLK